MNNVTHMPTNEELEADQQMVRYILEQMSVSEKAEFESKMAIDAALSARVALEMRLKDDIVGAFPTEQMDFDSFQSANMSVSSQSLDEKLPSGDLAEGNRDVRQKSHWMAASAAVIAVTLFSMVQLNQDPIAEYEGLSSDSGEIVSTFDSRQYMIVFEQSLADAERKKIAAELNFELVSGPGPGNTYVIRTLEPLSDEMLAFLVEHPSIDFLEPAL